MPMMDRSMPPIPPAIQMQQAPAAMRYVQGGYGRPDQGQGSSAPPVAQDQDVMRQFSGTELIKELMSQVAAKLAQVATATLQQRPDLVPLLQRMGTIGSAFMNELMTAESQDQQGQQGSSLAPGSPEGADNLAMT